jgi:hypothetical protein
MMATWFLLVLVVGGGVALVGLAGLVMLIVGIAKKMTALWVIGLVCLVPALLGLLVAVPLFLFAGLRTTPHRVHHMEPPSVEAGPPGTEGDYVRMEGDVGKARVSGVDIKVLEPGGGGYSRSRSSSHGIDGWTHECDLRLGKVNIEVTDDSGRITIRVEGRNYGRVERGDEVLVTEDRRVQVNGVPRDPRGPAAGPESRPF